MDYFIKPYLIFLLPLLISGCGNYSSNEDTVDGKIKPIVISISPSELQPQFHCNFQKESKQIQLQLTVQTLTVVVLFKFHQIIFQLALKCPQLLVVPIVTKHLQLHLNQI